MLPTPMVTVLMPVYNAGRYLGPAIESILQQTFRDFELLIVNDASTDGCEEILRSFSDNRIRILENENNLGLAKSLNRGLQAAAGELIARQDADDLSHSKRLESQVQFLRAHPDIALVGTQALIIDESGRYKRVLLDRPHEHIAIKWDLLFDNSFVHTSVMFRKTIVRDNLGGYDPSYAACEDYELWSRIAEVCHVANLPHHLVSHRMHSSSKREVTEQSVKMQDLTKVVKRNAEATFGKGFLSENESLLLAEFSSGYCDRSSHGKFVRLFDRVLAEYLRIVPVAAGSRDFKQTARRIYFKLFYNAWKKKVFPPALCFLRQPGWIRIAFSLLWSHFIRRVSRQRTHLVTLNPSACHAEGNEASQLPGPG
jgi:glycosyltransferase involved in cell wall biosynthesis